MSVWNGWQNQLLAAAILPRNADTRQFMTDWHQHANTDCANNPIDISLDVSGASPCKLTSNPDNRARNYASHAQAAGQFAAQIHQQAYSGLLAAIKTGNPYTVHAGNLMGDALDVWGSGRFSAFYAGQVNQVIGTGGIRDSHALSGWNDLRHVVNHDMRPALVYSQKATTAALRRLGHARKVGR